MVNGFEASVTRAYGVILAPYAVTTDEVSWIGSRDAWQQLMLGNDVDNINNGTLEYMQCNDIIPMAYSPLGSYFKTTNSLSLIHI